MPRRRLKGRKLFVRGSQIDLDTREFEGGDGESYHGRGYYEVSDKKIVIDENHTDDWTLAHEVGHALEDAMSLYFSEYQMAAWEELFAICRDPRNRWFVKYLAGDE